MKNVFQTNRNNKAKHKCIIRNQNVSQNTKPYLVKSRNLNQIQKTGQTQNGF